MPDTFDPTNPEHILSAFNNLHNQVAALELTNQRLADHNAELSKKVQELSDPSKRKDVKSHSGAPKLPLPEKYEGKRFLFRQFINSVKLHFSVSPDRFPDDKAKVGFVASLLRGPALNWITPYLELQDPMMSSWILFESKFKAMFDDPHRAKTAVVKLTNLRQGRRSVVVYAAEFRRIIMDADFDNNAQVYWFRAGLSDAILYELTHMDAETHLDNFIAQCILIDTRLREREVERKRRPNMAAPTPAQSAPASDAMQLDHAATIPPRGPISAEERKRRIEKDLCLYCGQAGHKKAACPVKSGNGKARQQKC
jgi:hypothetical protein